MNIKRILLGILLLLAFVLTGCSANKDSIEPGDYYGGDYSSEDTNPVAPAPSVDDTTGADGAAGAGGDVDQASDIPALLNRKIIYTASLGMSSLTPVDIYNDVISNLDTYGAYIESETITATKYIVKIRVLSDNFNDFIDDIKQTGEVISYSKTSQDITNAYSTFESRKLALETQQARIIELIEIAEDLTDILTLEEARADIESELNQIGASLANFDSLVDYSTINLTIFETTEEVVILPQTTRPTAYIITTTKETSELEITNQSEFAAIIYVDLLENGEFVRQYEGEAFPDGKAIFEISELESNTEYSFKITAISANERESNVVTKNILTESTFFNKVGNIFVGSFNVLVNVFEFIGLAIVAVAPFIFAFAIVFIPLRILYTKFFKQYFKTRKENRKKAFDQRTKERIKTEEEQK